MARSFDIHTDGGARGNPGPAGIGVVIAENGKIVEAFGRFLGDHLTNNQAEYLAVEAALQRAKELGGTDLRLFIDSELISSQLRREYKIKNPELGKIFLRVWNLMQDFVSVKIFSIRREENSAADAEVNRAIDAAGY
ncbi:MAG: ribonuclease HI family protein [Candidatus Kerfeldbacteria bacterium]|nr:ribonuclease HI family protein [Candidatus Kerfeldbacteria bacterium]